MESLVILNIILLVINFLTLFVMGVLAGYCYSKASSIPDERDIIEGIMKSKVPVSMPVPPGMEGQGEHSGKPSPMPKGKGTYFG